MKFQDRQNEIDLDRILNKADKTDDDNEDDNIDTFNK